MSKFLCKNKGLFKFLDEYFAKSTALTSSAKLHFLIDFAYNLRYVFLITGCSKKCRSTFLLGRHVRFVSFAFLRAKLFLLTAIETSLIETQDNDAPDYKKISASFRIMSRSFSDPPKAEESFQIMNQLKDANIWKLLALLVDPSTNFNVAWESRVFHLFYLGKFNGLGPCL